MARGQSNKEIAHSLGISPETARTHASSILAKLGVHSRTEAATDYVRWSARVERTAEILQRPAIAVLPLVVAAPKRTGRTGGCASDDGDSEALGLAAAMTRELATLLSRWCWFPVIAHAATRDPRSLGDTSGEIGRRLGARFLVDGELLRGRGRWRLTVHLIDAGSGHCVWSERYELAARRWFATQDAVCAAIAAAAYPRLIATVCAELPLTPEADPEAWQLAHRALRWQELRDRTANQRAEEDFAQAIARDRTLVLAHYGRGLAAYDAVLNQWGPARDARERLARAAHRCLELAPRHPEGHYLQARRQQADGHHDRAQRSLREAIGNNPSFAPAYALLGQTLLLTGDEREGLVRMQQACRLDPRSFVAGLAVAHFIRAEYEEASAAIERAIAINPRYPFARALAAACAWWRGDVCEAQLQLEALRTLEASFAPECFARTFGGERVEAVARLAGGLEQARRGRRAPRSSPPLSAASAPTRTAPRPRPTAR